MEEGRETTEKKIDFEGDDRTALQASADTLPSTEFVKVEKNLASLGFFTPSSKRLRNTQEKSFTITTVTDGKRLELRGTIIPSAKYGLPITADQDKWIALCKILTDIMRKEGKVTNPVSFSSAEILRLLRKHRHSGKNYREIEEWLDVLFSTTIFSEGVVYLANEKRRVKDRFRVFDRAVSFGKELPDGKVADKNYVWFSDWQLQNINSNHLLPIDLEAYRELKNHIAKALVPLLQVWLFATREQGVYEKRYDELCQMLNIRRYPYASLIARTLSPSLDELKQFGYLADWRIEETSDGDGYKIILFHGEKFHRDRRARLKRNPSAEPNLQQAPERDHGTPGLKVIAQSTPPAAAIEEGRGSAPGFNPEFLAELMKRGIAEAYAKKILAEIHPDQPVIAQLEWGDLQVTQSGGKILNPAGFYVSLVSGNVSPPPNFETATQRKAREEEQRRRDDARREQDELGQEYYWYCQGEVEQHTAGLSAAELASLQEAARQEMRQKHPNLSDALIDDFAGHEVKRVIAQGTRVLTLAEWKAHRTDATNVFMKPVEDEENELAAIGGADGCDSAETIVEPAITSDAHESETVIGEEKATFVEATVHPTDDEPMIILTTEPPVPPSAGGAIEPPLV